jgi:hypothetical protein
MINMITAYRHSSSMQVAHQREYDVDQCRNSLGGEQSSMQVCISRRAHIERARAAVGFLRIFIPTRIRHSILSAEQDSRYHELKL